MSEIEKLKLIRIDVIVGRDGILPMSKSTWWNGIKSGVYPQPVKLGPQITAWKLAEIEHLAENGIAQLNEGGLT